MGVATPTPDGMPTQGAVTLPTGWRVGAARETSQVNPQGQIVQGVLFPLTGPGGSAITVFIPEQQLSNTPQVQATILARIQAVTAITGE